MAGPCRCEVTPRCSPGGAGSSPSPGAAPFRLSRACRSRAVAPRPGPSGW
jgi:hypothetical protein